MVAMSARPGTFSRLRVSAVNRLAAISGKAAFLAPPIAITPSSGTPPVMRIRSIASALRATDRPGGPGAAAGHQSAVVPPWRWFLPESGAPLKSALASAWRILGSAARLFLAPAQIVAQRRRQALFAGDARRPLSRRKISVLDHLPMQRDAGAAVKHALTRRCAGSGMARNSAQRPRAGNLWRIVRCLLHRFETPPHRRSSDRRGGIDKVLAGL